MTYNAKYTYTVINPELPPESQIVYVVHAHVMDHSKFPALDFRDDKNRMISMYHLAPGYVVSYTDMGGYAPYELE